MTSPNKLIAAPSVYVVGKTTFDKEGVDAWVKARGFDTHEDYLESPVKKLQDLSALTETPEHEEAELMSELGGRFCYNSMMRGRDSGEYIHNILEQRHGSVLRHPTYNFIIEGISRSLSLELIRHAAGFAPSQESQRYVNAGEINAVVPPMMLHIWGGDLNCEEARKFFRHFHNSLEEYGDWQEYIMDALDKTSDPAQRTMLKKRANEAARSVLPNCAETRLVWTGNLQALRWFCEQRGSKFADLEIRRLAVVIATEMMKRAPHTFSDFRIIEGDFGVPFIEVEHSKV